MRGSATRAILAAYVGKKTILLRWKEIKEFTKDAFNNETTLCRTLDRLCEEKVLLKVDKNCIPIEKKGERKGKVFYLLLKKNERRAVWASDARAFDNAPIHKMAFRPQMSVYGMETSDFEDEGDEREEFDRILDEMNILVLRLMALRMQVFRRSLKKHVETLTKDIDDPIVRWMTRCYLWGEGFLPFIFSFDRVSEPLMKSSSRSFLEGLEKETLDDRNRERLGRSMKEAHDVPSKYEGKLQEIRKRMKQHLEGVVVCDLNLVHPFIGIHPGRVEEAFDAFVESSESIPRPSPEFTALKSYIQPSDPYVGDKSTLSLAIDRALEEDWAEFVREYFENLRQKERRLFEEMSKTILSDMPAPPDIEELKSYWGLFAD